MSTGSRTLVCVAPHRAKTRRDARLRDADPSISASVVSTQILGSVCRMLYWQLASLSRDTASFRGQNKKRGL
jgi:hypothetical protein